MVLLHLAVTVPCYAVFSMLGALLGLAFFRKKTPPRRRRRCRRGSTVNSERELQTA